MNVTTATPLEIDSRLEVLYIAARQIEGRIASALNTTHSLLGERAAWVTRSRKACKVWPASDATAEANLRARHAVGELESRNMDIAAETIAKLDAAREELAGIRNEQAELEVEYRRRPWSRFFIVTSSNGHIHKDMARSTCRVTTEYGWLPKLSGKTEAEAVEAHGPLLCTVCYPTAPVEWTIGKPKGEGKCSGGTAIEAKRHGMRVYGKCPTCNEVQTVNGDGQVRSHKAK